MSILEDIVRRPDDPTPTPTPTPTPRGAPRFAAALFALVVYVALALFATWPWALQPDHQAWGTTTGDLGSHIATPEQFANAGLVPFLPGTNAEVNAPEGLETQWALNLAAATSHAFQWTLALVLHPVTANSLFVVIGFVGSAFAMFLLVRWLTERADAALLSGLAFGFWPYAYSTVSQPLGHGWVLVLLVWRMLVLLERPTVRNGAWAGLATVFTLVWIQYWLLIAGVLWATLAVVGLAVAARRGRLRRALAAHGLTAGMLLVVLAGLVLAARQTGFEGLPERAAVDLITYSARPLMYLMPSPHHPLLGDLTAPFLAGRFGHPSVDPSLTAVYHAIYLGIPTMLLAGLGLLAVLRRRPVPGRARTGALAAAVVAVVALAFSAPPQVQAAGLTIPLPNQLIGELTTAFRTSARFGHLVMLAVAVLAAVGAMLVLRGPPARRWALVAVLGTVIAVDLWNREPLVPYPVIVPSVYDGLRGQPDDGLLALYPLPLGAAAPTDAIFHQVFHRRPLFNGYRSGSVAEARKLQLQDLTARDTVRELRAYGVRYVVVRALDQASRGPGIPAPGAAVPGLRRLSRDLYGTLYRVEAAPAASWILAAEGFGLPEGSSPNFIRWLTEDTGTLEVRARCAPCEGVVRFSTGTFMQPRELTIRDLRGTLLHRQRIDSADEVVRVPVRFDRRLDLRLSVDPGPQQVSPTDARRLSIFVGTPLRFERRRG